MFDIVHCRFTPPREEVWIHRNLVVIDDIAARKVGSYKRVLQYRVISLQRMQRRVFSSVSILLVFAIGDFEKVQLSQNYVFLSFCSSQSSQKPKHGGSQPFHKTMGSADL